MWTRVLLVVLGAVVPVRVQELPNPGGNGFSLHPPYFNLAEGTKITATATCGEDESGRSQHDLYCKLVGGPVSGDPSQTIQGQYCDICRHGDSDRAHPITNAIDGTERWWQSPPLSRSTEFNEVNVTLDLGQLFHVAYVLIKFANSPRPDLWVLERSVDFGRSYQPWQFFASSKRDCIERFGPRTIERISGDADVVCTTEYSRIVPLENGEVVVSLVNGRPGALNFSYSPVLRDFTKATNIRLRFLRTNTLLGHLMGKALRDPTVTRRYYYSIKDISIGGRCVCNGHAEACNAHDPNDPYRLQCDCQHNTCGVSCDQCCPGYNQLPWKPATTYSANECEACNCHRHSFDCYYDADVERRRASLDVHGHFRGGGVCLNCQHHTTGVNCERCVPTYYRSPDHALDSPLACAPCDCGSEFTDGTCEDGSGRCFCKPNYTGDDCDACAGGFTDYPHCYAVSTFPTNNNGEAKPAGEIINCECSAAGTVENSCRPDPRTRTCMCKAGFSGDHCDACAPGFYGLNCQACQCLGPGCLDGSCDSVTGHGVCRSGFHGYDCDSCQPGYFNYPLCQLCGCSSVGSVPDVCDSSGRCLCKPEFQGPRCEQCRSGFHSYPDCQECTCDLRTSLDASCSSSGHCHCLPNYSGASCDHCAPGYYGYPSCTPCQCSPDGSRSSSCDHVTGQCACLLHVTGLRCDRCAHGAFGFPNCQGSCHPVGSVQEATPPPSGQCECRRHVEGPSCSRCRPLFWNLSPDTPEGCSECECNVAGTISGVAECVQDSGQCSCKAHVCSGTCSSCKDGFFNLQDHRYFGCEGCQCDVGGAVGQACGDGDGRCRCRPNVEGPKCNLPRQDHYFPDLHHLKLELEDGVLLDGRPVRFGFRPEEFPGFSWRGYAQMTPIQTALRLQVFVSEADRRDDYLSRFILRYVNSAGSASNGKITAYQGEHRGSGQSKQVVFAPSAEPAFLNVPQNNFVEPFVLNPGTWTVVIEAEGVLLDYLVLLPSAYYEAPILQVRVTDACTYAAAPDAHHNCLLYRFLSLDSFPSVSGTDASCRNDNHLPRRCPVEKVTPRHPDMAVCSGHDISVELRERLQSPGEHVLVLEYASEEQLPQTLTVSVNAPGTRTQQNRITLLHCKYSFLCRAVAVDDQNRVSMLSLPSDAEVQLVSDRASFFLHKAYLVPRERFSMELVEPRVYCISTHGRFAPDSSSCVASRFQTPSDSLVLKEAQMSAVQEAVLASPAAAPPLGPSHQGDQPSWTARDRPPHAVDDADRIRLDSLQNAAVFSARVHALGRYVFIVHYHQPLHPTFSLQVYVNGGRIWQGNTNASFCPHAYGCRNVLVSENQIILDVTDHQVFLTIQVPAGRTLWLDYVLVVPESSYSSRFLNEEPLDKSYEFISSCGQNSFYISPSSSPFCLRSSVSLSSFFNNGAVPCACHEVGADRDGCEPIGGQCHCRPNVIGRDCSMCATGFWGFPDCRPCACGSRLCDPVSGACLCPPRTVRPDCSVCEPLAFGCHPLLGCEVCNCSRAGAAAPADGGCDALSGQCRCKDNVAGRQCDRCQPGYHGYPDCRPCDCNEAGTQEEVCDSFTGQCVCKENVQGSRCDQCRVGTFHLDPTNPKGCTSCFCFGATDRCRSSSKRRTEIMDMEGWVLLGADKQEVAVTVYPGQDLVEADLSDVPDVYQDLHWFAPKTYLGDKVSSYGGSLRYRLHTQTMRGDVLALPAEASRPDIILKGNQMTLVFMEREYPSAEDPHQGIVHMVEGSFRHARTGNSVSREELMMVLVSLESLQIRALHSQSAHSVSLRGAVLEGAAPLPAGRHANNVEICMCPANYVGDSCQSCAPGFYRDTIGLFLGKCVPCVCNGHSDRCLDGSGVCVDCQHNTHGDHCESCQGGFHGNNSLDGQSVSCSSCPCPLSVPSNNFAEGCVLRSDRLLRCVCRPGYSGPRCERCAPGYYGNPMVLGSSCQPCRCHGNTDSNMLFTDCHPVTGRCLSCMHHTAGAHCHVCAPGYHGDAIHAKNCTQCNCSPCGTESCDPHTGQCRCKVGVVGPQCDRCEEGTFGFDSCAGCRRCDCDAAAALVQPCDPQSGQCVCRPGVNGPSCRQCAPGHWDYSPDGCKKCDCRGGRCDPRTGECRCPDGMTGKQCDVCVGKYSVSVDRGRGPHCEACNGCVIVLLEDLDKMAAGLGAVVGQLTSLNASSIAWVQLRNLNRSMVAAARAVQNYNSSLDESRGRADMMEAELQNMDADIDQLEHKAEAGGSRVGGLVDAVTQSLQRAEDLLSFINNMTMDLNDVMAMANRSLNATEAEQDDDEREEKLREVEAMLREMKYRSCEGQKTRADRERTEAHTLLDRVHTDVADRQQENLNTSRSIRERLTRFHSQMMDLRDNLNAAVNATATAADVNNGNQKTLEDNKRRVDDLLSRVHQVGVQLQMAEDDVAQVNDVLSMLQDSKEEYERLAAQLDGARTPLANKVQTFTWTESKIPLVERAERHAALLDALARNLSSLVEDTKEDGLVDVTQAYNRIISSIAEAEDAANMAAKAAGDALENVKNQDLRGTAESLKNHSAELKEEVEALEAELEHDLNPELENVHSRLDDARSKQKNLTTDLENLQNHLSNITSNVTQEIDEAKAAARNANATATRVSSILRPIREQLDRWQRTYGDANATNSDINSALMEANKTVHMLGDTLPLLMRRLDRLQNHSGQMPNISENIDRIRQLIQQARNAASKVSIPVKFNGSSGVQVRNPSNLADLAAYTNLKFYITLPETARTRRQDAGARQFVLYLGNKDASKEYLGMALEGKRLRWFFNVGGDTAQVTMAEDVKSDGTFNSVLLERILQFGHMSMSSENTEGTQRVTKATVEAGGDQGLLSLLTQDTVFFVGGYPSSFTPPPPLALPGFRGCMELDSLNEEVLSLYNFQNVFHLNTSQEKPCGRSKPLLTRAWVNDAAYFDGTGFAEIPIADESARMQRFEQEVKVISHNGILLLLHNQDRFLCLAVKQGRLKVYYDFDGNMSEFKPKDPTSDLLSISDGDNKALEIIVLRGTTNRVVVRNNRHTLLNEVLSLGIPPFSTRYFLGGVPESHMPEALKPLFPKQGSLKGCFRNVKALNSHIDLKRMKSSGVSFGCDSDLLVAREAHFSGQSYLDLDLSNVPTLRNNFYASFSFRTDQKEGLMFYHRDQEGVCQVVLLDGHVVVRAGNSQLKSHKTYNDDNTHYVAIYNNVNGMRLYMDDVLEKSKESISVSRPGPSAASGGTTFLGGTPDHGLSNLTGCISNVFIRRTTGPQMVLNLLKAKDNVNVPMDCPAAKRPQQIQAATAKHGNKQKGKHRRPSGSRSRNTRESCRSDLSDQEPGAFHFSGSLHSFHRYDRLLGSRSSMPHISMSLRINSSEGAVLRSSGGRQGSAVLSLGVSDGHLLLLLDGGKRKVSLRSRRKYDDDQWHTVFIKHEGDKLSLITDGISVESKRITGHRTRLIGPLYAGGAPPPLTVPGSGGFIGCIRDLTVDQVPAGHPSFSQGTVPCFQNPLQPGAYFSGDGGHMAIDESLVLGQDLEVQMEVRPVSHSGLLLHAGTSPDQRLTVVLNQGEVQVFVNSGTGEFSASLTPEEPLCNGRWHTLTVVKNNNVLQLQVDSAQEHSVGPKQNRFTGTRETMYLGGTPGSISSPLPSFHGCIRRVSIDRRLTALSTPLSVHGAVGTQGCPRM